jgi:hypothetical protein
VPLLSCFATYGDCRRCNQNGSDLLNPCPFDWPVMADKLGHLRSHHPQYHRRRAGLTTLEPLPATSARCAWLRWTALQSCSAVQPYY